jgi:hypothetical protein
MFASGIYFRLIPTSQAVPMHQLRVHRQARSGFVRADFGWLRQGAAAVGAKPILSQPRQVFASPCQHRDSGISAPMPAQVLLPFGIERVQVVPHFHVPNDLHLIHLEQVHPLSVRRLCVEHPSSTVVSGEVSACQPCATFPLVSPADMPPKLMEQPTVEMIEGLAAGHVTVVVAPSPKDRVQSANQDVRRQPSAGFDDPFDLRPKGFDALA